MIHSERVKVLSAKVIAQFAPQAKADWTVMRTFRSQFYAKCAGLWVLRSDGQLLCVIGLLRTSMMGTGGEVMFLLGQNARRWMKTLLHFIQRALRRVVRLWGRLVVRVEDDFWLGHRFVQFLGFVKTITVFDGNDVPYTLYEMKKSWQ